ADDAVQDGQGLLQPTSGSQRICVSNGNGGVLWIEADALLKHRHRLLALSLRPERRGKMHDGAPVARIALILHGKISHRLLGGASRQAGIVGRWHAAAIGRAGRQQHSQAGYRAGTSEGAVAEASDHRRLLVVWSIRSSNKALTLTRG